MSNNKQQTAVEQIKKHLELPHRETITSTNTLQTKPFDNQKTEIMSNNRQQTAVEWLEQQTRKPEWHSLKRGDIFEQAKEMEKEQIINAVDGFPLRNRNLNGTEYYNETYGGNK